MKLSLIVDFESFSKVLNRPGGFRDPGEPEEYCRGFQVFDKDMTGFIGVGQLRYSQSSHPFESPRTFAIIWLISYSAYRLRYASISASMSSNKISFGSLDKSWWKNERWRGGRITEGGGYQQWRDQLYRYARPDPCCLHSLFRRSTATANLSLISHFLAKQNSSVPSLPTRLSRPHFTLDVCSS